VKNSNIINFENLRNILIEMMNYFIDTFKENNKEKLEELKKISNKNEDENGIKLLLDKKIPEVDSNQKVIDFLNNNYKYSSSKNFINNVKLLNNLDKLVEVSNKMNKRINTYHTINISDEKNQN